MRRESLWQALPGVFVVGIAASASAVTVSIHPSQDNTIFSENDNSNALGGLFAGRTPTNVVRRALLQFNVAGFVPAGSIISSVSLDLTQIKIGPAPAADFDLHRLTAAWGQGTSSGIGTGGPPTAGDATWNFRLFNTNSWTTAGGDFSATVSATTNIGLSNTLYTFISTSQLVSDAQFWLDTPASNFGWILEAHDESVGVTTAREFASREGLPSAQPTLNITFAPVPEPATLALLAIGTSTLLARRLHRR